MKFPLRTVEIADLSLKFMRVNTVIDLMLFFFNFSCSCNILGTLNSDLVTCSYAPFLYYGGGVNMTTIKTSKTQPTVNKILGLGLTNIMAITHHYPTKRIFYAGLTSVETSVIKELKLNGNTQRVVMNCKYNGLSYYLFLNRKCKTSYMLEQNKI